MRGSGPRKSEIEGLWLIEFVDEGGEHGLGLWSEEETLKLGKPKPPNCGTCCHPPGLEPRESYVIVGKITDGKVGPKREPIEKWYPDAED